MAATLIPAIAAAIAGTVIGVLAVLAFSIHRDDRAKTLTCDPRTPVESAARRILGVGVRATRPGEDGEE